jgi:hypothetical protein
MQRLMHNDTFALHVGKEALQQGSSRARKLHSKEARRFINIDRGAENVCVGSTPAGFELTASPGDESPLRNPESPSVVIRSRHGRPKLREANGPPPVIAVRCSEPSPSGTVLAVGLGQRPPRSLQNGRLPAVAKDGI